MRYLIDPNRYSLILTMLSFLVIFQFSNEIYGGTLLVVHKYSNEIKLFDIRDLSRSFTIKTELEPHEVAVSPDHKTAVVSNYGTHEEPGTTLTVIDLISGKKNNNIDLRPFQSPHGMEWLNDSRHILVTVEKSKALILVDVVTGQVVWSCPTEQEISHMVAIDNQEKYAYVSNIGSGSISVIDLRSGTLIKQIVSGEGTEGIDISPNDGSIWASNRKENTISIFDGDNHEQIRKIQTGNFPIRLRFSENGRFVFVTNALGNELQVFDTKSFTIEKSIPLNAFALPERMKTVKGYLTNLYHRLIDRQSFPIGVLEVPDQKKIFVALAGTHQVLAIDIDKLEIIDGVMTGKGPDGLAYSRFLIPMLSNGAQ